MNNLQLKMGIRELIDDGWDVEDLTYDFLGFPLCPNSLLPSEDDKQRFIERFRARIREAALRRIAGAGIGENQLAQHAGCNAQSYKKVEAQMADLGPTPKKTEEKKRFF
jgi:hypothetical protein